MSNTVGMIADAIKAGKSFTFRTTGAGFGEALRQLKASCSSCAPAVEANAPLRGQVAAGSKMRLMHLHGKDRPYRVIKL